MCDQVSDVMAEAANALAEICATITEVTTPAIETAAGYRDQMIKEGWSREAAEHIGIEIYQTVMEMVRQSMSEAARSNAAH